MLYNTKTERALLKLLAKRYEEQYGGTLNNLRMMRFSETAYELFSSAVPGLFHDMGGTRCFMISDYIKEFEHRGWIVRHATMPLFFYLTEDGYREATRSRFERWIGYLNTNPGISTAIALLSLLISFIALFVSGSK